MARVRGKLERCFTRLPTPTQTCIDVVRLTAWLALAAVALQTIVHLTNGIVLDDPYDALNADQEGVVFTWLSTSATVASSIALLLLSTTGAYRAWHVLLLSAVIAYLSLDDSIAIHERLSRQVFVERVGLPVDIGARLLIAFLWPLFLVAVVLLLSIAGRSARPASRAIVAGLGCLGLALFLELASGVLSNRGIIVFEAWSDVVESGVEEGLELGGWILISGGLFAEAAQRIAQREPG